MIFRKFNILTNERVAQLVRGCANLTRGVRFEP